MSQATSAKIKLSTEPGPGADQKEPTPEAIRERAYEICCSRNGAPGNEIEDWLQAERELRGAR